jgi:uncharacterized protein (TIGR02217 family)
MTDIGVLPVLIGQGWSVAKVPTFQTRVQRAISGRELRALDYPYPLWQFSLTYQVLRDQPAPQADLRILMGFYLACQGAFATFLYDDPTDDTVVGQAIGAADGATTVFQLVRTFGPSDSAGAGSGGIGFIEPIVAPNIVSAVYLNGVVQAPGSWSAAPATGLLTFGTAPPAGAAISADFSFYFRCRFMSDAYSFENFMYRLWSLKKLDFISVRP